MAGLEIIFELQKGGEHFSDFERLLERSVLKKSNLGQDHKM